MKQFKQKITVIGSAILIALTLVGINTDQVIAKEKTRKGANGRAGSKARTAPNRLMSAFNQAETLVSARAGRENVGRAGAFTVDMGSVEKVRLQAEGARRKTTKRTRQ
jgi:hypothetical protein